MFNANYKKKTTYFRKWLIFCDLGGARTFPTLLSISISYKIIFTNSTDFAVNYFPYSTQIFDFIGQIYKKN